jgi:hypothetical protein
MAKITITANTNTFRVDMGEYGGTAEQVLDPEHSAITETLSGSWRKENVAFHCKTNYILVLIENEKDWLVSNTEDLSNGVLQVDIIGESPVNSLSDLCEWLMTNHN